MTPATLALILALAQGRGPSASAADGDLSAVKDLYASASYEEALTRLAKVDDSARGEQVEQYRALCLLGLGRMAEAQRSLERMVTVKPLYAIPSSDVSPRLVSMFHDVRKRMLPSAARDLYTRAKHSLDDKRYIAASDEFKELLSIIGDDDMADQAAGFADLKLLSEGFLQLTDAMLAAEAKAVAPPPAPVTAAPPATPTIYSAADAGIVPPVEIDRAMPPWHPPGLLGRSAAYRGTLEVVIGENGKVESAVLRRPVTPLYDASLLEATKNWRFQPAKKNGQPVKYRQPFEIALSPR